MGQRFQSKRNFHYIVILTNSQAAINQIWSPGRPNSGQYLLTQIQEALKAILPHTEIILRWSPGHVGILGNELSNETAAEARNKDQAWPGF
jgi:ribonuclease HI